VSKPGPKWLQSALATVVQELGLGLKIQQSKVLDDWPVIVGEQIANVTVVERFDAGKLFVHVTKSTWRNELIFLKGDLIAKINKHMNEEIVKDIIFR